MTNADNRLSAELTAADLAAIRAALATIQEKLPFLIDLTPEESKTLARMGDKSRAFVAKALEVAESNPEILPGFFEVSEMRQDLTLYEALYPVAMQLAQLSELVNDTIALAGSEALTSARLVYKFAKASNVGAGLEPLIADMGKRFRGQGKQKGTPA
ncbi:MAG: hypothetical protein HC918_04785 [Oscillatoriales cyanobacterium SM2_1_8]|nr:hypothetical protein [Oscillatoriales cyanobacterium SM2_1_8]